MGMKHILRALDQALETAEIERKYLRDELEAERVEKQRLAAEMDELRKMAREPKAELDKLLETFREREMGPGPGSGRTWPGSCGRCAGKRSACRERWTAWRVKTRSCGRRWKNGRNHADREPGQ